MPIVIPQGFAQVTINWTSEDYFDSGVGATVIGVGNIPDTILGTAQIVHNAVLNNLIEPLSSLVTYAGVVAVTETLRAEVDASTPGEDTGAQPPPNVALLVRKVTEGRGRRRQGRMFMPAMLSETAIDPNGQVQASALTYLQGRMDGFLGDLEDGGLSMRILHNDEGQSAVPPPTEVTALRVEPKVATQRRRLR